MTNYAQHPDDALIEGILAPLRALVPAVRAPLDEALIERILAPLRTLEPAVRPPARAAAPAPSRWVARPRRFVILAAGLVAATTGVGYALEGFVTRSAPLSPVSPGGPLACAGLVGAPAARAAAVLAKLGLAVSWRVTTYDDPAQGPGQVTSPSTPPPGSVVEDVVLGPPGTVIVFLRTQGGPTAHPLPILPGCAPAAAGAVGSRP